MFKTLLPLLLVFSIGWAEGKKEKSIVKKKVIMITSDDEQKSKDINVETNIDGETLKLVITVNGDKKEFEVLLSNEEALESLKKELEEMDLEINIDQFMGHGFDHYEEKQDYMRKMRWHDQGKGSGYLGVQIQRLEGQLADYFGAKDGGVLITEVIEDSPAEKAGIKAGDVILSVAGEAIEDASDLVEEIRGHKPKSKVELNVVRKNRKRKMKVTLGEAPRTFDIGWGQGKNMMFFGDGHDFDEEDVDVFFNMDHDDPHRMMKKLKLHDSDDNIGELWHELKKLREEIETLKKDS